MAVPVSFGINVNTRVPIIFPDSYSVRQLLALAEEAEALGYDAVWVGDNFLSKARLEALTTLGALAARTRRVRLGTAACIAPLRHTVWLAASWATLDQLSGGRMLLNLCVGGGSAEAAGPAFRLEFDVAGIPYAKRGRILEEQIELLRALWTGKPVAYQGAHHQLPEIEVHPRPVQQPTPPIWVSNNPQIFEMSSGVVERMLRRVARLADGWMTCLATPEEYRQLWGRIQQYARETGRAPESLQAGYQMTLNVHPDRARARAEGLAYINRYYTTGYRSLEESMWARDPFGPPDECAAAIRAMIDAGARTFALRFGSPDQAGQLRRFTETVLPRLR
ncbi:MAG: LLM class flavin-dependent oxidoreductase [Deltaproteobacteria bacterium]|nr:LLM class flavin-dependent oxidoreductase [Deltaproteobacteria bacterium]MBI3075621.1 LLM class flavin-dependent oxidoreductase [Deltaproteobacteria bacterium]